MASTPRLRAGSYCIQWRLGGTKDGKFQVVTFPEEQMAIAAKALAESRRHRVTDEEVYRAILGVDTTPSAIPTLAEWIEQWGERKIDVQGDTLEAYLRSLRAHVVPKLGRLRLDLIDDDTVTDWVAWLSTRPKRNNPAEPLGPNTVRKMHALLHQVLAAAVPRLIPRNPAAKPPGSRRGNTGLPRHRKFHANFLEPAEADLVLGHCGEAIRDMVFIALRTGLRLGELVALRVEDVDLDSDQPCVYVRRALKDDGTFGEPKSEKSRRAVSISAAGVEVLRPRVAGKARSMLVFSSPEGLVWDKDNVRERHWKRAIVAAQRCEEHPPAGGAGPVTPDQLRGPRCGDNGGTRSNHKPCGAYVVEGTDRCHNHVDPPRDAVSTCDCPTRLHKTPRFHDTRHTHAAWLIATRKWDIYEISRRLGHESIQTTMDIYGHLLPRGHRGGLDALDELAA